MSVTRSLDIVVVYRHTLLFGFVLIQRYWHIHSADRRLFFSSVKSQADEATCCLELCSHCSCCDFISALIRDYYFLLL